MKTFTMHTPFQLHYGRRRILVIWLLVFTAVVPCWAGEPTVAAVEDVSLERLEGADNVEIMSSNEVRGDPAEITNPILKDIPIISRLKGATITISFTTPQTIGKLAIPRVGWDDWAVPDEVAVSIDGKDCGRFHLTAPPIHPGARVEPPAVDVIDLGREVSASRIEVEILEASPAKGRNKHGTLRILSPTKP